MTIIEFYTIYDNPSDYPGKFVVRRMVAMSGKVKMLECVVVDSLELARVIVPVGLHRVPRFESDDPVIVETWV